MPGLSDNNRFARLLAGEPMPKIPEGYINKEVSKYLGDLHQYIRRLMSKMTDRNITNIINNDGGTVTTPGGNDCTGCWNDGFANGGIQGVGGGHAVACGDHTSCVDSITVVVSGLTGDAAPLNGTYVMTKIAGAPWSSPSTPGQNLAQLYCTSDATYGNYWALQLDMEYLVTPEQEVIWAAPVRTICPTPYGRLYTIIASTYNPGGGRIDMAPGPGVLDFTLNFA